MIAIPDSSMSSEDADKLEKLDVICSVTPESEISYGKNKYILIKMIIIKTARLIYLYFDHLLFILILHIFNPLVEANGCSCVFIYIYMYMRNLLELLWPYSEFDPLLPATFPPT